jgi:hypothetical protein
MAIRCQRSQIHEDTAYIRCSAGRRLLLPPEPATIRPPAVIHRQPTPAAAVAD